MRDRLRREGAERSIGISTDLHVYEDGTPVSESKSLPNSAQGSLIDQRLPPFRDLPRSEEPPPSLAERAISNYWSRWPRERDSILRRALELRQWLGRPPTGSPDHAPDYEAYVNEQREKHIGGLLGWWLFGGNAPILDLSETGTIAAAPADILRAIPPVSVSYGINNVPISDSDWSFYVKRWKRNAAATFDEPSSLLNERFKRRWKLDEVTVIARPTFSPPAFSQETLAEYRAGGIRIIMPGDREYPPDYPEPGAERLFRLDLWIGGWNVDCVYYSRLDDSVKCACERSGFDRLDQLPSWSRSADKRTFILSTDAADALRSLRSFCIAGTNESIADVYTIVRRFTRALWKCSPLHRSSLTKLFYGRRK
jgi:hypothetical protein